MNGRPDIEEIEKIPLFFIVGRPRTGSTLLRTLFDAHPNVIIPQEWPMLLALYRQFGKVTRWDEKTLEAYYESLFQEFRIKLWKITNWPNFDAAALHSDLLAINENASFETVFKVIYSHYHSPFPKAEILLIGDKNPVYSNQAMQLAEIFPGAKFIHLTRDYRDNLVSMLDVDFEMPNPALLSYRWKYSIKKITEASQMHPERFYHLPYEELVADAPGEFRKLCSFLGIPFEDAIFDFYKKKDEIESLYPVEEAKRYFSSLLKPIDSSKVGIYQSRLTRRQVKIADLVAGKTARTVGYVPENTSFGLLFRLWVFLAVGYAKWLYKVGWMVSLLPYKTMMWLLNKPSVVVRWYSALVKR